MCPTIYTESYTLGDVLKYEQLNKHSRDQIVVLAAQTLSVGSVLGKVTAGSVPTTGTLTAGAGANGTMTSVTGGVNVKVGSYIMRCVKAVSNAGDFEIKDPDGNIIGIATTGVAFTHNQINFTINDGATDYSVGDYFTVAVPAGGGQMRAINFSGVDGSTHAVGLSWKAYNAAAPGTRTLAYNSGGTYEVLPGDILTGHTSSAYATVVSCGLSTGTWAGGNAAGTFTLQGQVGTFSNGETFDVGGNTNVATNNAGGDSTAVAASDIAGVAVVRDAEIVSTRLVWPTGATAAQKAAAIVELNALGITVRDYA